MEFILINSRDLYQILKSNSTYFETELSELYKIRLVGLISQFLGNQRKHNNWENWSHLNSQYMSSKELRKKFSDKKDKSSYYLNVINEYFDCVDEIYKKGKGGYTKKYKLKEWIKDLTKTYLKNNDPIIISDISDNEKKIIDLNGIGMNGVVGLENEDFNKSDIFIPSTIKINIEKLDEWIEFLEFTDNDIQKVSKDRILFQLMCVRRREEVWCAMCMV